MNEELQEIHDLLESILTGVESLQKMDEGSFKDYLLLVCYKELVNIQMKMLLLVEGDKE